MITIGLTGGIATGKSTVKNFFTYHGTAAYDADEAAHNLLTQKDIIEQISKFAPETIKKGVINRAKLGQIVFENDALLERLEALLHPCIRMMEQQIMHNMQLLGKNIIILDIPLLFETRNPSDFDLIITTSCPERLQIQRALARNNITKAKLEAIMARQIPTHVKEKMADIIISTGLNKAHTMRQVQHILANIS